MEDCLKRIPKGKGCYDDGDHATVILEYGAALKRQVCHWRGTAKCVISTTYSKQQWTKPYNVRVHIEGYTEPESGLLVVRCKLAGPGNRFFSWDIPGRTLSRFFLDSAIRDTFCPFEITQLGQVVDEAGLLVKEWAKKGLSHIPAVDALESPMASDLELA